MSTSDLPPFSGNAQCPKCRAALKTTWHPCGMGDANFPCLRAGISIREHLCRTCGRCGYGWLEATADAGADEKPQRLRRLPSGS